MYLIKIKIKVRRSNLKFNHKNYFKDLKQCKKGNPKKEVQKTISNLVSNRISSQRFNIKMIKIDKLIITQEERSRNQNKIMKIFLMPKYQVVLTHLSYPDLIFHK